MKIATIRNIDPQGRIVIPADIRKKMCITEGDALEIETNGQDIHIRKYMVFIPRKEQMQNFLNILHSVISGGAFICTPVSVAVSKGVFLAEGTLVPQKLASLIQQGQELVFSSDNAECTMPRIKEPIAAILPINHHLSDYPPLSLILFCKHGQPLTNMELGSAKLVAATLGQQLS